MPRIIPSIAAFHLARIDNDLWKFSENYEFAAMKSAGISLQRAMRSLIAFFLLSVIAFFFANNVIPYAEYKFINFRKNIAQVKPAMAIAEGQFSDVEITISRSIKIRKQRKC
jgi:lipopolysaccharide export system permease protein